MKKCEQEKEKERVSEWREKMRRQPKQIRWWYYAQRRESKGVWADEQNVHWPSIFNVEARELERQWRPLLMLLLMLLEDLVSSLIDKRTEQKEEVIGSRPDAPRSAVRGWRFFSSWCFRLLLLLIRVRCTNTQTDTNHLRFALLSLAAAVVHRKVRWGTWHYILVCACGSRRRVFVFLAPSAAAALKDGIIGIGDRC